jgi:hypothetical protein
MNGFNIKKENKFGKTVFISGIATVNNQIVWYSKYERKFICFGLIKRKTLNCCNYKNIMIKYWKLIRS